VSVGLLRSTKIQCHKRLTHRMEMAVIMRRKMENLKMEMEILRQISELRRQLFRFVKSK
jgi:hypothetical protein